VHYTIDDDDDDDCDCDCDCDDDVRCMRVVVHMQSIRHIISVATDFIIKSISPRLPDLLANPV